MLAIAMTTAPRPQPTIDAALASLRRAGFNWSSVMLVNDADKIGPLPTWVRALTTLVEQTNDLFLMVVQDDASWAIGARAALDRELDQLGLRATQAGLLSPFLVDKVAREITHGGNLGPGWHPSRLGYSSGGALCYILPRKSAEALLSDDGFREIIKTHERNIDRMVPGRLLDLGFETLYRYPSLVHHRLGSGNSSIKPKKPHDTHHFRGVA